MYAFLIDMRPYACCSSSRYHSMPRMSRVLDKMLGKGIGSGSSRKNFFVDHINSSSSHNITRQATVLALTYLGPSDNRIITVTE